MAQRVLGTDGAFAEQSKLSDYYGTQHSSDAGQYCLTNLSLSLRD